MSGAPYAIEACADGSVLAFNDDLRVVAAGASEDEAVAHFVASLGAMLEWLEAGAPARPAYERALAWFDARGPRPRCLECDPI